MKARMTATNKALAINLAGQHYGTFAEIGAGQEVARHFFMAGKASQTIAKTMSAYDMKFSDEIYGREAGGRYVCEPRLFKMLSHEYDLVDQRLKKDRGDRSLFFAYANTVSTNAQSLNRCHGWMGIRYQAVANGPTNDIIMHVKMKDQFRLQQQDALGILGVNLIHSAFSVEKTPEVFVASLYDNIHRERIEIDMIRCSGPELKHIDNHLIALELVRQGLTRAVMFNKDSHVVQASEELYNKAVVVQRGTFRPVTNTNVQILEHGLKQFKTNPDLKGEEPVVFLEMTMNDLAREGEIDVRDFLDRIETISCLGHNVLISNFALFFQLKEYLRQLTSRPIAMLVGASTLPKLYDAKFYGAVSGGVLDAFGRLFDPQVKLLVYPYNKDQESISAKTFKSDGPTLHLHQYLTDMRFVEDIEGFDRVETGAGAEEIRELMKKKDPKWESLVPKKVAEIIKAKRLFQ